MTYEVDRDELAALIEPYVGDVEYAVRIASVILDECVVLREVTT